MHTSQQCIDAYGIVRKTASGYLCQITGSSCPVGWTRLSNWGVTHPRGDYGATLGTGWCGTGSHEFANVATETCTGGGAASAMAALVAVGCY